MNPPAVASPPCSNCGDEIIQPDPERQVVAPGGWCVPSEVRYALPELPPMCGDCKTRMAFASEFGFDPGRRGENLRAERGGVTYGQRS